MSTGTKKLPLDGVVVIDLTQFLAGPFASQILGDLGARVIRVEPLEPELARTLPPHMYKGDSAYFLSINRNKESIALDLRKQEGKDLLKQFVGKADMLIENFRPGVAARLGLAFEALKEVNPKLVMCSISGFGQSGPYRDRPAYDIIVQAMSGGMSITGPRNGDPVRAGLPLGDLCAGMYGVIGMLAALLKARETGVGLYVDISMLDCQVAMLSYQAAYHLMSGEVPGPQGESHDSIATYRGFRCGDGVKIVVAANTEAMWANLCAAVGQPALPQDPRFVTNNDRYANRGELDAILENAFSAIDSVMAMTALIKHNVPAGVINTLDKVVTDEQVLHRDMVMTLTDEEGCDIRVVGNPVKIGGADTPQRFPPALGEHSRSLLEEFAGRTPAQIEAMEAAGLVATSVRTNRQKSAQRVELGER
jgi:CoA:oxalate CoA-transferase